MSQQLSTEEVRERIRAGAYTAPRESRSGDVDRQALMAERARQRQQFQADAINATGLAGHPKAEGIFNYAYSQDHAYGLEEVLSTLSELAEVLL